MKHLNSIDIVRSLSMLYILIFHCGNYTEEINFQPWGDFLKNGALGTFMFISGYLLGRKYTIFHGIDAVKSFFINRAIRILPLFFLSLLIYLFMGYLSVKTVLLSMTGFSVIIPPQPPTLWFVSMIILFYYLFPIMSGQRISSVFMIAGCIILAVMAAQGGGMDVDRRFYYYFPCFIVGITAARYLPNQFSNYKFGILGAIAFSLISTGYLWLDLFGNEPANSVFRMLIALSGTMSFISLSYYLTNSSHISFWASRIAYSSMAAYLFHRQIFSVIRQYVYWPEDGTGRVLFLLFVCIPIILLTGYIIQTVYDYFLKKLVVRE